MKDHVCVTLSCNYCQPAPTVHVSAPVSNPFNHIDAKVNQRNKVRPSLIILNSQASVMETCPQKLRHPLFVLRPLVDVFEPRLRGQTTWRQTGLQVCLCSCQSWPIAVWQPCLTGALMSVPEGVNSLEKVGHEPHKQPH